MTLILIIISLSQHVFESSPHACNRGPTMHYCYYYSAAPACADFHPANGTGCSAQHGQATENRAMIDDDDDDDDNDDDDDDDDDKKWAWMVNVAGFYPCLGALSHGHGLHHNVEHSSTSTPERGGA
eukprot:100231-Amphidinium_carterae.1